MSFFKRERRDVCSGPRLVGVGDAGRPLTPEEQNALALRKGLWDWFAEALAPLTMPQNSQLAMFNPLDDGSADRYARFTRHDGLLFAATASSYDIERSDPAKRRGSVDMSGWGGWLPPVLDHGIDGWARFVVFPAQFSDYEDLPEATAAFRFVSGAGLPHEIGARAVSLESGEQKPARAFRADGSVMGGPRS